MHPLVRSALAVLAGIVVATLVIVGIEALSMLVYPLPPGFDMNDKEALARHIAAAPLAAMLLVLLAYLAGTFAGAWLAARLAGRAPFVHGLIVGALFQLGGVVNLMQHEHPLWFAVACLSIFLPAALIGAMLARRSQAAPTPDGTAAQDRAA